LSRKPLSPEKLVEREVLAMCKLMRLDVSVVESKAKFSESQQRYRRQETEVGFSDVVGNDEAGMAVFIELKARGKLNSLRPAQRAFLLRKIHSGCFATVVDSGDLLYELYRRWKTEGSGVLLTHLTLLD
jgi:RecB family endonuclease NucS